LAWSESLTVILEKLEFAGRRLTESTKLAARKTGAI
jgi:hypothetical protein